MRFVYFGSSQFSRVVLAGLASTKLLPVMVITTPDKPKGRGLKVRSTPVKEFSVENKIETITPYDLKEKPLLEKIRALNADIFIVASYGNLIPRELLDLPRIMPIAVHPSLLPRYRGAAPINWAIMKGEKVTGVSIFKINEKIDAGEIIIQQPLEIEDGDDAVTLSEKLAHLSSSLLLKVIPSLERKTYRLIPQDESKATFAPKLKKEDGHIKWDIDAFSIRNLVRGLRPWPEAFSFYRGKLIKILEAEAVDETAPFGPSTIVRIEKDAIYVAAGRGIIKITKVKPEGKREMLVRDFLCGHHLREGEKLN